MPFLSPPPLFNSLSARFRCRYSLEPLFTAYSPHPAFTSLPSSAISPSYLVEIVVCCRRKLSHRNPDLAGLPLTQGPGLHPSNV